MSEMTTAEMIEVQGGAGGSVHVSDIQITKANDCAPGGPFFTGYVTTSDDC